MRASKETAREARHELSKCDDKMDALIPDKETRDELKRHLLRIDGFLLSAESKLPTEASYERDNARRRKSRTTKPQLQ